MQKAKAQHTHIHTQQRERQSAEKPTLQNSSSLICAKGGERTQTNKTKAVPPSKKAKETERNPPQNSPAFLLTRLSWFSREFWRGLRREEKGVGGDYINKTPAFGAVHPSKRLCGFRIMCVCTLPGERQKKKKIGSCSLPDLETERSKPPSHSPSRPRIHPHTTNPGTS